MRPLCFALALALCSWFVEASDSRGVRSVAASKPFFSPSLGQTVDFSFSLEAEGLLTVSILDRDGFVVRTLVSAKPSKAGPLVLTWDGRDDGGAVVPDEAYSLKIDLARPGASSWSYFPADAPSEDVRAEKSYYDRKTAILAYKLPRAGRVHMQAGIAKVDEKTGERYGPVLKTIVNREPRPSGPVIEQWNGLDETSTYYIPDLSGFVVAIAATSLPENAVITTGNRAETFAQRAQTRAGSTLFTQSSSDHHHHRGLTALEDASPSLSVKPTNATLSLNTRLWSTDQESLKGSLSVQGPSAGSFLKQPGHLEVFVDESLVLNQSSPSDGMAIEVPLKGLAPGPHIVAFDWGSDYGPTAVTSIRVSTERAQAGKAQKGVGQ